MVKHTLFLTFAVIFSVIAVPLTWATVSLFGDFSISSPVELGFFAGFAFYLVVHVLFYKPVFMHVMAHELTHALFALAFGGTTKKLEVSDRGGRVMINRSNFLISLAPYFIPLYTFIFMLIFVIAKEQYLPYIAFLIGGSMAFHLALTLFSMKSNQSDFYEDSNIFFSLIFIYVMNLIIIAFVMSVMSPKISFNLFLKDCVVKTHALINMASVFFNR